MIELNRDAAGPGGWSRAGSVAVGLGWSSQRKRGWRAERMNGVMETHLGDTYFAEYQVLRAELAAALLDADLAFRPGPTAPSLGELCREIGEIEHSYVEAYRTFRQDFAWRTDRPEVERSVSALGAWYAELDADLQAAMEALSDDDVAQRRILRADFDVEDFHPLPPQNIDIYREALLIFYGKASVYLHLLGKELPGHWGPWIG
jgi:hypothetical protein